MSVNQDTGSDPVIEATVGINPKGCRVETTEFMHDVRQVRAVYRPAHTIRLGHGIPDTEYPATVAVRVGNTTLTLTPEVWAAVNDAVREVLPIDVVPA